MTIEQAKLKQIRDRVDLVAYMARFGVELKKRGNDWTGLCPFHAEKTPSFNVRPDRGRYKCFGCDESGDVFSFTMKLASVSFPEAVRQVAAEVGIEVENRRAAGESGGGRSGGRGRRSETGGSKPRPATPARSTSNVREIGEAKGAKVVETYDYRTKKGRLVYQVCRMEPKSFRQRRPWPGRPDVDAKWVWSMKAHPQSGLGEQPTMLYRIPELAAAIAAEDPIWIVEGEKDVEAMMAAEQVATCNTGGAGAWRPELAKPFEDYAGEIRIVQDRDEPGKAHARDIYETLSPIVAPGRAQLAIFEPREGKDASDHLGAGLRVEDFVQVWPLPDDLIETDPKRFKRLMLRRALESPTTVLDNVAHHTYKPRKQPLYTVGLAGLSYTLHWQGCVVISGEPSTGKSYLTIATGVDNAETGWDVYYLSCEMSQETIRDRAARAIASRYLSRDDWANEQARERAAQAANSSVLPDRFHIVDVGIGVTIEDLIEFLADNVSERPTLVIVDSVSSFTDNMAGGDRSDAFGMADLKEVQRWVTAVSKFTHGQIAFLILSEINTGGRVRGRSLDHRCDYALAMTLSDDDAVKQQIKTIRTTKSWHGPVGKLGDFVLWWQLGRLAVIEEAH